MMSVTSPARGDGSVDCDVDVDGDYMAVNLNEVAHLAANDLTRSSGLEDERM